MSAAAYSIVPYLRALRADGVPPEQHIKLMLAEVAEHLGQDGMTEWMAARLRQADRVLARVLARACSERIDDLEKRVIELESRP